jgi:hypothetical protein
VWRQAHPFAYHVIPLHLIREVLNQGALLSKKQREERGILVSRPTTAAVDILLGFADVIHWYIPNRNTSITDLPILGAQLAAGPTEAFPHAVLRAPIATLTNSAHYVCRWNIAVSRPGVSSLNVKGGNWARGTRASRILEVWKGFRDEAPEPARARGRWIEGFEVPLLTPEMLATHRRIPESCPELLVPKCVTLEPPMSFVAFSDRDKDFIEGMGALPVPVERAVFDGYSASEATYASIRSYFNGERSSLAFDAVRRRS